MARKNIRREQTMLNDISRRSFLKATGAGLVMSQPLSSLAGQARTSTATGNHKPNIIFVFADQMRSSVLGCYGNTQVSTPHFDRLAAGGAVFDNAISTWPVCSPFRGMLLTGLYPMHNHVVSNDTQLRDDVPTIATVCKANGYATGYIGKWHLEWKRDPFVPRDRRMGFEDLWVSDNCRHKYFNAIYCSDTPENIQMPGYQPEVQARMAVDFMREHKGNPFCLFMSWGPPHDPYKAPDSYMAQFEPERIELRDNVAERDTVDRLLDTDPSKLSKSHQNARQKRRDILDNDLRLKAQYIRGYYALTKSLDDCMGNLLDALKELGIEQDTIIAFSSDHGDMLGSHRMASKQMPYEEAISIPFMVRFPSRVPRGRRTDALLGPIDIMPTLLGLAGIACPKVDGADLSHAAIGRRGSERDALLIMKLVHGGNPWICNGITPWRGVRTKRYTYARLNDRGPWILFDNRNDPYQMNNLINDPAYALIRKDLDGRTNKLLQEADDPDDTEAISAFRERLRDRQNKPS
jgi:arylsulfatase A-like enzyme